MPNKNKCTKCGQRCVPPTGKKCKRPVPLDDTSEESEVNMTLDYCNKCGQSHEPPRGKNARKQYNWTVQVMIVMLTYHWRIWLARSTRHIKLLKNKIITIQKLASR